MPAMLQILGRTTIWRPLQNGGQLLALCRRAAAHAPQHTAATCKGGPERELAPGEVHIWWLHSSEVRAAPC
jgi:hypothetical protein